MALEQSVVFRQLERGSRFSRFDLSDAVFVLLPFNTHYLLELFAGGSLGRPWVTLIAAALAIYIFRMKFPEGLSPVLHVLLTPRHLSALVRDEIQKPYPAVDKRSP